MKNFKGKRVRKFIEEFEEWSIEKISMKLVSLSVDEQAVALENFRLSSITSKIAEGYMRKNFKKQCKDKDWNSMKKYLLEEYPEIEEYGGKLEDLIERNNTDVIRYC